MELGIHTQGQLGDNTIVGKLSPVSVIGGFTNWCSISMSAGHSIALRQNGTIWAWGQNVSGQLGNSSTGCVSSPVSVVGGFTDWCQVAAAYGISAGIRSTVT